MKKYVLICCLTFGAMSFFSSCSLYYYDRGYGYAPPPPRRVIVIPRPPVVRYAVPYRPHHRGYRRGYRRY